jgi:DNA-binding transcriptional LysR family regulator
VRAAALAGLAITPLPESAVIAGLRILNAEAGLPRLPDLEFAIYERPRPEKAAAALAAVLLALAKVHRARLFEMAKNSNPPEVGCGSI